MDKEKILKEFNHLDKIIDKYDKLDELDKIRNYNKIKDNKKYLYNYIFAIVLSSFAVVIAIFLEAIFKELSYIGIYHLLMVILFFNILSYLNNFN